MKKLILPLIASLAALPGAAFGQLLSYEGFDFTGPTVAGDGSGTGWFTGSNWTVSTQAGSSNYQIGTGSLSYSTLVTNGNHAVSSGNNTHILTRRMAAAAPSSGSFWASIVVDTNNFSGGLTFSNNADNNFNLISTVFSDRARFGFGINAGNFVYILDGREGSPVFGSVSGATADPTLLVAHFDVTNGVFNMWANPTIGGSSPTGGTRVANNVTFTRSGSTFAGDVTYAGLFSNWNTVQLDEVRLGTTFAGVTPVPEPSTAVLLALGLGGLIYLRRRRTV